MMLKDDLVAFALLPESNYPTITDFKLHFWGQINDPDKTIYCRKCACRFSGSISCDGDFGCNRHCEQFDDCGGYSGIDRERGEQSL